MYCRFYGFSERPFEPTPDPKFLYLSPIHREVQSSLLYGIRERRGFIVVLGEAGTGKTTLLRSVCEQLEEDVKVATIINTDVTFDEFLHMVLVDLGLADVSERLGKVAALQRLNELAIGRLRGRGNVVIMVDEAQNLDRSCLENLRLLSNLETSKTKLLQIVLSGQPELEDKLRRADLRQLLQRVNLRRHLMPFDENDTGAYIRHRLSAVHYTGPALFKGGAQRLIWHYSGGIPRKINTVCDNALLTGYALKRRRIDEGMVREVIDDLARTPYHGKRASSPGTFPVASPRPLVKPARTRAWRLQLLLPAAGLGLLAAIGLLTWPHHLSEKRLYVLPEPLRTTAADLNIPPADLKAVPHSRETLSSFSTLLPDPVRNGSTPMPNRESTFTPSGVQEESAEKTASPVARVTAEKANAPAVFRSGFASDRNDPLGLSKPKTNPTQPEAGKKEAEKAPSTGEVLVIEAEADRPPHLQAQPGPVQAGTAPRPVRETRLQPSAGAEQKVAATEDRKSGDLNPVLNAIKGMFTK